MNRAIIVAIDFDGVLCDDKFPEIGDPNYEMISFVRKIQDHGIETILWTSRIDEKLEQAVSWCKDYGLHFTAINDNTPSNLEEYGTNPRKIFADIYIDDRSPYMEYKPVEHDLKNTIEKITRLIKLLGGKL